MRQDQIKQINEFLERNRDFQRNFGHQLNDVFGAAGRHLREFKELLANLPKIDQDMLARAKYSVQLPTFKSLRIDLPFVDQYRAALSRSYQNSDLLRSAKQALTDASQHHLNIANSLRIPINLPAGLGSTVFASSLKNTEIEAFRRALSDGIPASQIKELKLLNSQLLNGIASNHVLGNIHLLQDTFVGRISQQVRDVMENAGSDDEVFERIQDIVEESIESDKQTGFSRFERIQIIFQIIILVMALYGASLQTYQAISGSTQQDAQIVRLDKLIQLNEKILESRIAETTVDPVDQFYIAERTARLFSKPSFRSQLIGILGQATRVRVINRKHKWLFIESFNFIEGTTEYGWVNKKYLKHSN